MTCNAAGRDESRESPELRRGWQRPENPHSWGGGDRDQRIPRAEEGVTEMLAWGVQDFSKELQPLRYKQPRDGERVMLYNQKYKEGTEELDCLALAGWREANFPCEKLKKREKEELFPMCSVRTKLHQERLRLYRRKKSSAGGILNALGGWSTAEREWMSICQECHRPVNHCQRAEDGWDMWRSLPTLAPCLHSARMWDELCPGGLHQHFSTRQAHYSIKPTLSAPNREKKRKLPCYNIQFITQYHVTQ